MHMTKYLKTALWLAILAGAALIALSGCTSAKDIHYFQDIDQVAPQKIEAEYQPVIMKDDKLQIVISGPDKSVVAPYNFTLSNSTPGSYSSAQSVIPYLVDSNGDIVISGGVIRVSLPAGGTNSALDYGSESGGTCTVTGGEIVACGSYSMAEGFDESSTQCAILYNFSEGAEAGSTVSLETLDGQTLVSYTVPCSFDSAAISVLGLQLGESYRIVIGDRSEEITLTSTAASYGNAASSMFGGPMNWGSGMQRPGGRPGGHREERTDESGAPAAPPEKPNFGGERPGGDEMSLPPDMPDFGGERPDGAEMGPPPDMPDFGGEFPGGGEMTSPTGMPDFGGERPDAAAAPSGETEPEQAAAEQTQFVPDAETWILLTLSLLALAGGLLLVFRFEP